MPDPLGAASPRVAFYSPDPLGLGHLTQTLTIADALRGRWPAMTALLFTGLSIPRSWGERAGLDSIKLPAVRQVGAWYEAAPFVADALGLPFEELRALRAD